MDEAFSVASERPKQSIDVTDEVREAVRRAGVRDGLCHVMVLHSTAAIVVNETDDPNIGTDIVTALDRAIPDHAGWLHDRIDDNAHSHIKATILGPSETLAVSAGELVLGTWQRVMLMEFDGPRKRRVHVKLVPSASG
ncbi:MAG: secondary thiamine-phosphate synthase enzyme YjbQ [Myxococcota bacterium]|nr:secondary thiamine-phosphate synthase enzyme YjbQ [Myxococcota bacterium]